ncbi:tyrosine-type recombinase/integrase [Paenibacillus solani]|uniref:Uncharacterized protein n=1 Tax=Paenibacillus solani TaxID=1705565 RepID=A0A0M1P7D8_9BACL|nr:tyrosine-type recombinase/integrase [Paenibacillus solani]KOR90388.1 hypothetical protein AM231_15485 [Paenibacillus solani]
MNYLESINKFIAAKQEAFVQVQGYEKDLLIFWRFLETKKVNEDTWNHVLGGANTDLVLECLKFYVDFNKVNSMSTANRFISVLAEYFQFAIEHQHISNKELYEEMNAPIYSDRSFRARINSWISKNLKDKEATRIFSESEIQKLIKDCNDTLDLLNNEESDYFDKKFVPALILKILVLTGMKYKKVPKLTLSDLNLRYGTIKINNYIIHMPHRLIDQFEMYLSLREDKTKSNFLFIKSNGDQIPEQTSNTAYFLGSLTTRTDIQGIIKYVIVQMLGKGISVDIISEFTGVGKTIIDDCLNFINKDLFNDRNTLLDARIRELNTFKHL